jgi:hypothetical protein
MKQATWCSAWIDFGYKACYVNTTTGHTSQRQVQVETNIGTTHHHYIYTNTPHPEEPEPRSARWREGFAERFLAWGRPPWLRQRPRGQGATQLQRGMRRESSIGGKRPFHLRPAKHRCDNVNRERILAGVDASQERFYFIAASD